MTELNLTWSRLASVWWLVTWRSMVGAFLIGAAFGAIVGFVGSMAGLSPIMIKTMATYAGGAIGIAWGAYVLKTAFAKRYGDFRIALVPA